MHLFEITLFVFGARLSGPLRLRFIIQPIIAILLGWRDGRKDAREGAPPYLIHLLFHPKNKKLWKSTSVSIWKPVLLGIIMDAIAQYLIFKMIYPGQALIVGTLIIAIPYALTRGLVNRVITYKKGPRSNGRNLKRQNSSGYTN